MSEKRAMERFVEFESHQVFEDATTYTALQFFRRSKSPAMNVADAGSGDLNRIEEYKVSWTHLGPEPRSLLAKTDQRTLDRMRAGSATLQAFFALLACHAETLPRLVRTSLRVACMRTTCPFVNIHMTSSST